MFRSEHWLLALQWATAEATLTGTKHRVYLADDGQWCAEPSAQQPVVAGLRDALTRCNTP